MIRPLPPILFTILFFLWKKFLFAISSFYKNMKDRVYKYIIIFLCIFLCLILLYLFIELNNKYKWFDLVYIFNYTFFLIIGLPNYFVWWYIIASTTFTRTLRFLNRLWDNITNDLYDLFNSNPLIFSFCTVLLIIILIVAYYAYDKYQK